MVDIGELKSYILEQQQVETILQNLGCHHIKNKGKFFQCANPDGDNPTAICVYLNDYLTTLNYTRDITKGHSSADIFSLAEFILGTSFPKTVQQICSWVGLDYYHDFESDLPESFKITKELMALQNDDISSVKELTMVKPIPAVILNYYTKAANPLFFADNISYQTQKEFELGYDPQTNHITIPIRDELGTLVGVKGRLFGTPQEGEPKYTYLEPCAKGRILYGLYKTLPYIKSNQKVYVGEAEKSVMQMWSMGVQNCVATGGKTISGAQVEMLTRLCVPIVFLFDKDVLPEELESLSNRFIAGTAVYVAIDTKDILSPKQSPTDDPGKFARMIHECVRRIK